jgi:hypothetical protein
MRFHIVVMGLEGVDDVFVFFVFRASSTPMETWEPSTSWSMDLPMSWSSPARLAWVTSRRSQPPGGPPDGRPRWSG